MQLSYLATFGHRSYDVIDIAISQATHMESKTDRIRTALAKGDWLTALRTASRFHDRSNDTLTFKRGFDACRNRDFYKQLGKNPDELVEAAIIRLHARFANKPGF